MFRRMPADALVQVEKARAISQRNSGASPGPIKTDGDQSMHFMDAQSPAIVAACRTGGPRTKPRTASACVPFPMLSMAGSISLAERASTRLKLEPGATRCLG